MAEKKTTSSAPVASHQKKSATTAISEHTKKGGPYSVEQMRATMSTGGGEPIPAGHRWTNEKRRLQPRDPETGHFTYNSDAQYGLKYKSHGKGNAVPVGMKSFKFHEGIKKGDKIAINDGVWIAIKDMSYEEVRDYFSHFDEESGEYYSYGEHDHSQATGNIAEETTETHDLKSHKLSSSLIKKRGRVSKEERERMDAGETHLGEFDMSKLGKYSQAEMTQKMQEYLDGFNPSEKITMLEAEITVPKKVANEAHNDAMDAAGWIAGAPFHSGFWATAIGGMANPAGAGSAHAKQPSAPAQPSVAQAQQNTAGVAPAGSQSGQQQPTQQNQPPKDSIFKNMNVPSEIMSGGMFQKDKIDYSGNQAHKKFFDDFYDMMKKNPAKFNITDAQVKVLDGQKLAYLAKKGIFDGIKF